MFNNLTYSELKINFIYLFSISYSPFGRVSNRLIKISTISLKKVDQTRTDIYNVWSIVTVPIKLPLYVGLIFFKINLPLFIFKGFV